MIATRTAIVTGSTSGIGLAIAEAFAAEGCNIVVNSFSDTPADRAIAEKIAGEHEVAAAYIQADMSKAAECRALVAKAAERFGSVDVLVNNAGIQHVAPVEEFPIDKWDAIIAINLTSAFHTIAAAIPLMKKAGGGRIINIASAHGLVASAFKSAYVAAKHGIMGLTKTVALEVARDKHHLQRHLPRLRADPAGRSADSRPDEGAPDGPRHRRPRGHARSPADQGIRQCRAGRSHCRLPRLAGRSADQRHAHLGGWRMDGPVITRKERRKYARTGNSKAEEIKPINIALQGGGSHGAFSWEVLDQLLEDGWLDIKAVSGTSTGAMNAAALA